MKMTSAQAAKLLRSLNDELFDLLSNENNTKTFTARTSEDIESVRPEYDYADTLAKQIELQTKIRKLKHRINVFNSVTVIGEFDMTIDEMLVYIPQLTSMKNKLASMKDILPKQRDRAYRATGVIDYIYANYDVSKAKEDYLKTADELARAQTALDFVNNTVEFDF